MNKILVSYFSASGTTKNIANDISKIVGGDLFQIEPEEEYTSEDLDWTNRRSRSSIEMNDKSFRPKIKSKIDNISEYNKVIIGFPVWWYTAPSIINSFIEENNLEGKEVYIFVTYGSSSVDKSLSDLRNLYPNINFVSGKRLSSVNEEDIRNWINI